MQGTPAQLKFWAKYSKINVMLKLIINADDLGISQQVNWAIEECFRLRFLTSTTLMVNMDYADEGAYLAKKYGWEERVGLHLNLTSGRPLTRNIRRYKCFCDRKGNFNAAFAKDTFSRFLLSKDEIAAAREEAEAQIRKYLSYGLADKHLDSHHHVHTDPSIWEAVSPLVTKYGLRSVRISRNLYARMSLPKRAYKYAYNRKLWNMDILTSDYFGSFDDFKICRDRIRDKSLVEIMVHPTYDERGILRDVTGRGRDIEDEREYFRDLRYIQEFY